MSIPSRVSIVEVGPRDGLQNEKQALSPHVRAELISRLAAAGLTRIEAGSFVSPTAVPQMAHTDEVLALVPKENLRLSVLVPNLRGLSDAIAAGADEIAVFAAASETFSKRNINCSIEESLERYAEVVAEARRHGVMARGYVSCVLGCPYEGEVDSGRVAAVAGALFDMGCFEVSLGDTIGVGAPLPARRLVERVARVAPIDKLAVHFHDTYGQSLANIFACLEVGVCVVDSSVAGLGGCPFAPGAAGNVATEDVVYMLQRMDVETGVSLDRLLDAGAFACAQLNRAPASRVAQAYAAKCDRPVDA
ncbi:hydroxymethylglutaryl-CoA lyase [Methylocystis sp. B8]|uniref:hydroxymethylglutaryl-CoA lyase n=1 Tax=Methylocystis sp. B8 TaxID=544938 RepID=UPI0010FD5A88|nr:hydroxymethylglutaryl-CoA lyase [Methylocystis sp. B8]TLG78681.1 hydroxymethylglutaryl-CoA lyase [Methylocystis sp. B8]